MLEQTPRREADTNGVVTTSVGAAYEAAYDNDRSRLFFALVLLLVALAVVLVNDREFWFGNAEAPVADETSPEWIPNSVVQPPTAPAAKPKQHVATAKSSAKPAVAGQAAIATNRNVIPPLEVEVVAGNSDSKSAASGSTPAEQGPATAAAERVQIKAPARPQPVEVSYPLLGRQMKVQGSVLLQALIGADGVIRNLRVLSGPAILASAAREAARQWQFKPYLQNGQPVETQANITVNFTIKVLNNGARDQMDSVVALSRGGE
ncbi:MAG TPA: TonB family protein [Terriglobales bacterium]|nr:TonB family protein [Terriglobales bacterium]